MSCKGECDDPNFYWPFYFAYVNEAKTVDKLKSRSEILQNCVSASANADVSFLWSDHLKLHSDNAAAV